MTAFYNLSYTIFVVLTALSVLASATSIVFQALVNDVVRGAQRNWNVVAVLGSYVALAVISLIIYLSRKITVITTLRDIPKPYVANKEHDIDKVVAKHIALEYDRTCAIAFISLPPSTPHDGWGTPGTEYEDVQFRRAILDTVLTLDKSVHTLIPTFPSLKPHQRIRVHFRPIEGILTQQGPAYLERYDALVHLARYEEREPTVEEYEECMRLVSYFEEVFRLLQSGDSPHASSSSLIIKTRGTTSSWSASTSSFESELAFKTPLGSFRSARSHSFSAR